MRDGVPGPHLCFFTREQESQMRVDVLWRRGRVHHRQTGRLHRFWHRMQGRHGRGQEQKRGHGPGRSQMWTQQGQTLSPDPPVRTVLELNPPPPSRLQVCLGHRCVDASVYGTKEECSEKCSNNGVRAPPARSLAAASRRHTGDANVLAAVSLCPRFATTGKSATAIPAGRRPTATSSTRSCRGNTVQLLAPPPSNRRP